jgi:hypothetical protein
MHARRHRNTWLRVLASCAFLCFPALRDAAGGEWSDGELKAAYIYNFAKFVEWPSEALGPAGSAMDIGVLGSEETARELAALLSSHSVHGHPIAVRHLSRAEEGRKCPIVFVAEGAPDPLETGAALAGWPVLTVGEGMGFVEAGGMIALYLEEDRLRFAICPERVERNHLRMSAKLLALSHIVESRR